jgi:hypothetical protein
MSARRSGGQTDQESRSACHEAAARVAAMVFTTDKTHRVDMTHDFRSDHDRIFY